MRKYNEMSEDKQIKIVKRNGYNIQFILNPSKNVQLEAVREKPFVISYINNPFVDVEIESITYNIEFMNLIRDLEYNTDNKDYPYYHIKGHKEYRMYTCEYSRIYVDMSNKDDIRYTVGCQRNINKDKFMDWINNNYDEDSLENILDKDYQEFLDIINIVENENK